MPCQTPHLDETTSANPDLSPGVVAQGEWLLRSVFYPDHFRDGKVVKTAISLEDLRARGFSVNRQQHVNREVIESGIDKYLENDFQGTPRKFVGIACFTSSEVRDFKRDDSRAFVVIDTALPCNRGHASVYAANPTVSRGQLRRLRDMLLPLLRNPVSVDQVLSM